MVMGRHRPLWGRLWARFRGNRHAGLSSSHHGVARRQSRRSFERSDPSLVHAQPSTPEPYSETLCGGVSAHSQFSLLPQSRSIDNFRSVHTQRQDSFSNNPFNFVLNSRSGYYHYYTPKCLVGLDCQAVLTGEAKYDDFSENCWLENHLHRFGGVPPSDSELSSEASETSSHSENSPSSSIHSSNAYPNWHSIIEDFNVPFDGLPPPPADLPRSSDSPSPQPEVYRGPTSTVSSHSSGTVSDITHFYSSMGLTGMAFSETGDMTPPPPYSELPNEPPPPPYTQEPQTSNRNQSNLFHDDHAILW